MPQSKYEISKKLGQGAFGEVFKAKAKATGKTVAIKAVENYNPTSTPNEIAILRKFKHQCVIGYIESFYFEKDGKLAIVMEFADDGSLEEFNGYNKADYSVWRFLSHMADALHYLHTFKPRPILHRDLKPANVLCVNKWNPEKKRNQIVFKIADFGLAELLDADSQGKFYAYLAGTPIYLAPEVSCQFKSIFSVRFRKKVFLVSICLCIILSMKSCFNKLKNWTNRRIS